MNEKEAKTPRTELGLNYISIEFPFENAASTQRSQGKWQKQKIRIDTRPNTAQSVPIIHSSPQYLASIAYSKQISTACNFNSQKSENLFKIRDGLLSSQQEFRKNLGRFQNFAESSTFKIKSFKIEKPEFQKKPSETFQPVTKPGEPKLINDRIFTADSRVSEKKRAIFKNKSEMRLKSKIIEIPVGDLPRTKKLIKGKIIKNHFTVRTGGVFKKDLASLFVASTKRLSA